jgi:hypothetical protein
VGLARPAPRFFLDTEFFWASPSSREDEAARKACETAMAESISNPKPGPETEANRNLSQVSSFHDADAGDAQVQLYSMRLTIARNYLDKMRGTILDTRA